jgi:4-diphosphocytidyl-2C-methyl-D-erythritol kinase
MNEITWALIQLMDGEMKHDLQSKTGLPQEDCDRIWNAYQLAIKDVKVHEVIDNFVDSQVPMDSDLAGAIYSNLWELYDR